MVHCWTSARSRDVRNTANNGHCSRWAEANALSLLNPAIRTDRLLSRPNRIVTQAAPDFASSPLGLTAARPNRQAIVQFRPTLQDFQEFVPQSPAVQHSIQHRLLRTRFECWRQCCHHQLAVRAAKVEVFLQAADRHRLRTAFAAWRHAAHDSFTRRQWAEAAAARSGCAQRLTALETKLEQLTRCMQLQTELAGQTGASSLRATGTEAVLDIVPYHAPSQGTSAARQTLQQNVLSAVTLLSQDCRDIAAGQLSSYTSPEVDSEDCQQNLSTGSTDAERLAVLAHSHPATGLKDRVLLHESNMQQVWHALEMLRLSPGCLGPPCPTTSAFYLTCPPGCLTPSRATTSALYLTHPPGCLAPSRATTSAFHLTHPPGGLVPTRPTTSAFHLTCPPYMMVPMHRTLQWPIRQAPGMVQSVVVQSGMGQRVVVTPYPLVAPLDPSTPICICISTGMLERFCMLAELGATEVVQRLLNGNTTDRSLHKVPGYVAHNRAPLSCDSLAKVCGE
ncbi:TPA: hypothetical protein ACH3X3_014616 [Trebouxia sp. C0006]